jgi:hypothetical protein
MKVLEIIKEDKSNNIAVIGDSIAVGIKNAGGVSSGTAVGGSNTSKVLGFVKDFVQSGKAKGATVILSSGAANTSKVITEDGKVVQQENFSPVATQIKLLKDAGATVVLVGTASKKTPPQKPTQFTNGKSWVIDYSGVNEQLASIASANGAKFLGPLEEYDNTISQHDGIHPYNGYSKLFQAGASVKSSDKQQSDAPTGTTTSKNGFELGIPSGRTGTEVADIQKVLVALGFDIGPNGVDGIRGPDTSAAVKQLQSKLGVTVDGDPGPETVGALNKLLSKKPDITSKLTHATASDVKASPARNTPMAALAQDAVTTGKVGKVLDLIAKPESGGSYDVMQGGKHVPQILDMTLSDLYSYQKKGGAGGETAAAGRYQYMPGTLLDYARRMGVDWNRQKFDPKFQDQLAIYTMRFQCKLDGWLDGKVSDGDFLNLLSKVWAGLPNTSGLSTYQGVGSNKAGVKSQVALNTLSDIRSA